MAWLFAHYDQTYQMVGDAIYASIYFMMGRDRQLTSRIVGMMISLSDMDIHMFLSNFWIFHARVMEAYSVIQCDTLGVPLKVPVPKKVKAAKMESTTTVWKWVPRKGQQEQSALKKQS